MPRHRNVPFKTLVFENYSRSEAALIASMAEMVVSGVATRKVSNIMETLCGTTFSKSSVSEVCKDLIEKVNEFKDRPLTGDYPFLIVDATYFKVREKHRIVSKAFMIAYGTNQEGHREILGFEVYDNESKETWNSFLQKLKKRGLQGLLMITSDAHEGIQDAVSKVFPEVPWQRCQFHFARNISENHQKISGRHQSRTSGNVELRNYRRRTEKAGTKSSLITETLLKLPCHASMKVLKVP